MRKRLVLAVSSIVLVVGVLVALSYRLRPGFEFIRMETVPKLVPSEPSSPDISWTRQERAETPDSMRSAELHGGALSGELFASEREPQNACCSAEQNGFRSLRHARFPDRNIFTTVGLNFQHLLSGRAKYWEFNGYMGNFAPRREPSTLRVHSQNSAGLFWAAANSRWNANSEMTFTLGNENCVDLEFRTALETVPEVEYLVYMWASYLRDVKDMAMRFWGVRNLEMWGSEWGSGAVGWARLDEWKAPNPVDSRHGIVQYLGTPTLAYDDGIPPLNLQSYEYCAFLLPFFFGVVDGDRDPATADDDMAYIMMFDQADHIRFAMWDFSENPRTPVWDWQYVLCNPRPAMTYGYRARLVYKPYMGLADVTAEYVKWLKSLDTPRNELRIEVDPPDAATLFPKDIAGTYSDRVQVCFGVNPSRGWAFDHWEGNVTRKEFRFTKITLKHDEVVRAVCRRIE